MDDSLRAHLNRAYDELVSEQAIDGDTTKNAEGESLRLKGIEAPETAKPGKTPEHLSQEALDFLDELLAESGGATREVESKDFYGRDLGVLRGNDGRDLNAELAKTGAVHRSRFGDDYADEFHTAQKQINTDIGDNITDPTMRRRIDTVRQAQQEAWAAREANDRFIPTSNKPEWDGSDVGTFENAFLRGKNQSQAMLYAAGNAIGELFGSDVIAEWGLEGIERNLREAAVNPPEIHSYEDVESLADAGTYIIEAIGEQAPQLLTDLGFAVGTGGASVMASMAGRAAVGKFFKRQLGEAAYGQLMKKMSTRGAVAGIYGQTAGETQLEYLEQGIDAPGTALAVGMAKAGLEYAPIKMGIDMVFKKARAAGAGPKQLKEMLASAGTVAAAGGSLESVTEVLQTVADKASADMLGGKDWWSEDAQREYIDAALKAFVVGSTLGGAGSLGGDAVSSFSQREFEKALNELDAVGAEIAGQDTGNNQPDTGEVGRTRAAQPVPETQGQTPAPEPQVQQTEVAQAPAKPPTTPEPTNDVWAQYGRFMETGEPGIVFSNDQQELGDLRDAAEQDGVVSLDMGSETAFARDEATTGGVSTAVQPRP